MISFSLSVNFETRILLNGPLLPSLHGSYFPRRLITHASWRTWGSMGRLTNDSADLEFVSSHLTFSGLVEVVHVLVDLLRVDRRRFLSAARSYHHIVETLSLATQIALQVAL
jgi:hypothetical protein